MDQISTERKKREKQKIKSEYVERKNAKKNMKIMTKNREIVKEKDRMDKKRIKKKNRKEKKRMIKDRDRKE